MGQIEDTLAKDVEHIKIAGTGHAIYSREEVANFVELPLLNACLNFYDKNIQTCFNDTGGTNNRDSIIEIDYDTLDGNNKKVAEELIASGKASFINHYSGVTGVTLVIPTSETTTVSEVDKASMELAEMFSYQDILFGRSTIKQKIIDILGTSDPNIIEDFLPEGITEEEMLSLINESGVLENSFFDKEESVFWEHENFFLRHKQYLESKKDNHQL